MRAPPPGPANEFDELRRLLLSREQQELAELRSRLGDKQLRAHEVAGVLPQALKLSRERGEELARALQPAVEGSVRQSINANPQVFVEALHPILGPMVRRSIAESLRRLLQSLNQTLEHTFSWQGLKWRLEAWRTGKSFAEIVMLRSLVYRVEQVFLVHRETSLSLLHVAADASTTQDSDMVAGMLSAIQDFARDSFKTGENAALEEFRIGETQVWIAPGRHAYLAAVIRGNPPRELRTTLEETIDSIHILQGSALAKFNGDAAVFQPIRPELETCLRSQYEERKQEESRPTRASLVIGGIAALLLLFGLLAFWKHQRWQNFLGRLQAEPGLAVTAAENNWFTQSRLTGLRDPLAPDGIEIAQQANLKPSRIQFAWKEYLALDPESVRRRFAQRFGMPAGTTLAVEGTTASVSGAVPFEWLERVRREGTQVPGVNSLVEKDIAVQFDPTQTLARFKEAFPPPATIDAQIVDGALVLSGISSYEWIAPVREGALRIPGITKISGDALEVEFNPKLVQERFDARFGLPDTVKAAVQAGTLTLSGEAPHAWIERVRSGASEVAGIRELDERNLEDTDLRTFQQSKSVIETAFIYFLVNKDNFATEGFAALSRLPDEIRRCFTAAQRTGISASIEVRGYADAVGAEAANADLSRRRAVAVRDFLISCGLSPAQLKAVGLGAPPAPAPGTVAQPEQSDRRVALHVAVQPAAGR